MSDTADTDVLVIGGGIAGLTAALALSDRGRKVTLLERSELLGGRASSWSDPETGDPVHIGPHIFLSTYPNTWKLLDRIGTRDKVLVPEDGPFITLVDGTRRIEIAEADLPPPAQFLPSLLKVPGLSVADVLSNWAVTGEAMALDEKRIHALDGENALSYLRRRGVTERFIDWYWRFMGLAILNVPLELCSAGALLRFYGFQVGHKGVRVGYADGGLGDVFAPAARQAIESAGGSILLKTGVKRILAHGNRAVGVELADGRRLQAEAVVAALPPTALLPLLPAEWTRTHPALAALSRFQPVPYRSVYLWFDQKLTDLRFWARVHHPADLNCDFYDLSNIHTGWKDRPSLICSNVIWSQRAGHLDPEALAMATRDELAEFLPDARKARLRHWRVHEIPMAIHAPFPGTEQARPRPRSPVEGLVLAGDWVQTGFPSSMEGAVRSGWMAAEVVLEDRGQPEQLSVDYPPSEGIAALYPRLPRPVRALGPEVLLRAAGTLRHLA